MKYFFLILSNLKRKKLRTVLTILSIAVAFFLFGALSIINDAFNSGVNMAGADKLMVRHKTAIILSLPVAYQQRILNIPGVKAATHITWFGGIYKDDSKNFIPSFPVEPESYIQMNSDFILPEEQMKAWLQKRNGVVVGRSTFERFAKSDGWQIGSKVPMKSPIWGQPGGDDSSWDFEIVGVYEVNKKGKDDTQFLIRYDYFDEGRAHNKGEIGWFTVRVHDPDQAETIAKRIDEEFANSPYETKAEPEAAAYQSFVAQVGNIGAILAAVLSAVFFTILLVAGNTMAQAVRERIVEIGVLKSLGFTNALVLLIVLAESTLIALIGGGIGLTLASLVAAGDSPVPNMFPIINFPQRDLLIGIILIFILGMIAGLIPAVQAMRLQIANALRR